MIRKPNALLFMMLLVTAASLFAAEAYSQVQAAGKGVSRPVHHAIFSVGAGMDYWSGDWRAGDINRYGSTVWASTTIWHCLGINAEGHSMIVGGNRNASNYKLFVGDGGLICTFGAWDRFKPIAKAELGFASLTQPGNGTGKLHSTYGTWSLGGGVEIHTRGHWWTRAEYTYDGLPKFHSSISNLNHTLNPRGISVGLTYRFGARETISFPEPVVFDQETENLPGPYTANRTPVSKPNAPAPDTATGTPVARPNVPAPATATGAPVQSLCPVRGGFIVCNARPPALPNVPAPATATGTPDEKIPESATSRFTLGPADVIHVNVWKNTELSQTVTVGPDGFITLPLLKDIHVSGMTADEVAQTLRTKLNYYIVNPQVNVSVMAIHSRQVFILGQVGKPGSYPLIEPIDVLQLIALAGGLTVYANHDGITILREGKGGTEKIRFNYNNVVHGDGKQDVLLQPGDTVVVP
jgi:polysaccharide biosynthesis/export protein